jgi:hypothetical protein
MPFGFEYPVEVRPQIAAANAAASSTPGVGDALLGFLGGLTGAGIDMGLMYAQAKLMQNLTPKHQQPAQVAPAATELPSSAPVAPTVHSYAEGGGIVHWRRTRPDHHRGPAHDDHDG